MFMVGLPTQALGSYPSVFRGALFFIPGGFVGPRLAAGLKGKVMLWHCRPDQLRHGDVTIRQYLGRWEKAFVERQKPFTAAALTETARVRRHNQIALGSDTDPHRICSPRCWVGDVRGNKFTSTQTQ